MGIIKTGLVIDGVEVTSEHIGKELLMVKVYGCFGGGNNLTYKITEVDDDCTFKIVEYNDSERIDWDWICEQDAVNHFKWVEPVVVKPKESVSKQQRQKLAKAIREAKAALDLAVSEAEEVGMVVDISMDGVKITFNPHVEEY